ncbi:sialidase family protein [Ferruginibacter sp.]|uniref:sialidase family protein n=1 Tax=Ferruginibacter sp. TaxID=1940288 RepID=UPI0026598F24|nr:sialidase family protein [Ferruginibacter sp.]
MKRLFVFVPAIILVSFGIYAFVLKEKKAGVKTNIVFKSADGGQTWQDISEGLPDNLRQDSIRGNSFFLNDKGLFLKVDSALYKSTPNATAPYWTKEIFHGEDSSIAPGKPGTVAYKSWTVNVKKTDGTSVWSPVFDTFQIPVVRSTFETAGGAIFIGTQKGFFKTDDNGSTWKQVYAGTLVGHMAEADGVLLATNWRKLIRSTDNGETWAPVTSDSSEVWDVKQINRGFAAMIATSASNPRGIKTSYDGGKTWQPNNAGNKDAIDSIGRTWNDRPTLKAFMPYIFQVGENLVCAHRDGIFKSSDKGKTWKLLLPAVDGKAFNLFVSGNLIYAIIPGKGGC